MRYVSGPSPDRAVEQLAAWLEQLERRLVDLEDRVRELEGSGHEFRETLNRLGEALVNTHDRTAIVSAVLDASVHHLRAAAGVFYLVAGGRDRLRPMVTSGTADEGGTVGELVVGEGVAGHAAQTGHVALWPGPGPGPDRDRAGPSPAEPPAGAAPAVALPVRAGGHIWGVLALYGHSAGETFSASDVQTLTALVRQVEPAIQNTYLYEEAERLAITDGLTSLWNRRHFELRAKAELQRAVRFGEPFSIVMVDVDWFKRVNDEHGHQTGDAVLIELAQRFIGAVRDVDVVARIGGEEFALILPSTDEPGGAQAAERVRAAVAASPFALQDGALAVTVSAGVATWPVNGTTVRELLASADAALYEAKEAGRNRVVSAPPRAPTATRGGATQEGGR